MSLLTELILTHAKLFKGMLVAPAIYFANLYQVYLFPWDYTVIFCVQVNI